MQKLNDFPFLVALVSYHVPLYCFIPEPCYVYHIYWTEKAKFWPSGIARLDCTLSKNKRPQWWSGYSVPFWTMRRDVSKPLEIGSPMYPMIKSSEIKDHLKQQKIKTS